MNTAKCPKCGSGKFYKLMSWDIDRIPYEQVIYKCIQCGEEYGYSKEKS